VGLVQLVRFLVLELIYLDLNSRFDIGIIFMVNYSFSGRRRLIFIGMSAHIYIYIYEYPCLYCILKKLGLPGKVWGK
jgi:hypothetical protein